MWVGAMGKVQNSRQPVTTWAQEDIVGIRYQAASNEEELIRYSACSFPGGKAAGSWIWPLTSNKRKSQEYVDLYIHYPIHLHGLVVN
jgi:hypothetical protein